MAATIPADLLERDGQLLQTMADACSRTPIDCVMVTPELLTDIGLRPGPVMSLTDEGQVIRVGLARWRHSGTTPDGVPWFTQERT